MRLILAAAAACLAVPAAAQNANCAPHAVLMGRLADQYGETREAIAMGANGAVVEIWASRESGSWTITVTEPGGPTCLVASGMGYEVLAETLPPAGIDG